MNKIFSGKKTVLPSWNQIRYAVRLMSHRERLLILALAVLIAVGFLGTVNQINARFSNERPAPGGVWKEGIVGSPRFVNPLLAISDADRDLTALVYSGLMRPDGRGGLVPDLAQRYEISEDGLSYTFHLREGLRFHDREPLSADDIIFTVKLAKNPSVKSLLRANWEGVEVEKVDEKTVRFWLKRPYIPFLENTTLGILPQHIWKDIDPEQIALSQFNAEPTGTGPYEVADTDTEKNGIINSYTLEAFKDYALGRPNIKKIALYFYPSEVELINAYELRVINALDAVSPQNAKKILRKDGVLKTLTLPRVFGVFFNQNEKSLFTEKTVREALTLATDKEKIVNDVLQGYAQALAAPLPPGTFGALENENVSRDMEQARVLLEKTGWRKNETTGIYEKIEKKKVTRELAFSLATSNAPDLIRTANILKQNWEELGARVEVKVFEISDLNQNVIRPRKYDALLFGEVVGREPDPFAFWHSSQRNDPGLNIALYTNRKVDKLLEEVRNTVSPEERRMKYEEFQKAVTADSPAIFLYSPYFLYLIPSGLKGFETEHITVPAERFANAHKWHFETVYVWKIFE